MQPNIKGESQGNGTAWGEKRRPRQSNDSEKEGPKSGREKLPPFGDYRPGRESRILFTYPLRYGGTGPDIFNRFMSFCMNPLQSSSLFHTRHREGKEREESGQALQESITRATGKGFVQRGIFVTLVCVSPP